jgi:hypothetical protein
MVLVDNLRLVSVSPKAKLFEPRSVNARSLSVEHAKSLQSDVASPMSALETNCPSGKGKVQDRGEYGAAGAVATTNLSYPANLVALAMVQKRARQNSHRYPRSRKGWRITSSCLCRGTHSGWGAFCGAEFKIARYPLSLADCPRRGWDSNPRCGKPHNGFRVR